MASTILVTGATGFAGRYVVPALQSLGYQVRGTFNRAPGTLDGVDWRHVDMLESPAFDQLVEGCDAVVHLAAELRHEQQMQRLNVDATRALLAAAQAGGVRYFGYASSIVVYGSPRMRDVDEDTPLLDPAAPLVRQYHAEPYMLAYAHSKTLAELAIREFEPSVNVDLYRPAVVADLDRLLEAGNWSSVRKFGASYRCTQYIYAPDAAAALAHLVARGLASGQKRARVEAYNICDETCGTYRQLLDAAYAATGEPRYRVIADVPYLVDFAKDLVKYRNTVLRFPLGALRISNRKLRQTGFSLPVGVNAALRQALARQAGERAVAPA